MTVPYRYCRTLLLHSQRMYFAVVSLIVGFPYVYPGQVAWTSRNSNSVSMRTISVCITIYCSTHGRTVKPIKNLKHDLAVAVAQLV